MSRLHPPHLLRALPTGIALALLGPAAGLALGAALASGSAAADTRVWLETLGDEQRVLEGYRHTVLDRQAALVEAQQRAALSAHSSTSTGVSSPDAARYRHYQSDSTWVADIGTLLYRDLDQDGYHSGFSLTIDVDTDANEKQVYASITLQRDGEEPLFLHTTNDFIISGDSLGDEYRIEAELLRRYTAGLYDVTIDIHDAWTETVLDTVSANTFSNLRALPLEAEDDDLATHTAVTGSGDGLDDERDVRVVEHAGATAGWLLLLMGVGTLARQRRG